MLLDLGLDLSASDDLTAMVAIWGNLTDGFDVGCRLWLPEDNIVELEHRHHQPYREWHKNGLISLIPGPVIDDAFIERDIVEFCGRFRARSIFIDPWNARTIGPALQDKHGLKVEFLRQGWASLNTPTKTLSELIVSGRLRHENNPILTWHASNCIVKTDAGGNIKLDKSKRRYKIDAMAALCNAVASAIANGDSDPTWSPYDTPGNLFL